MQTTRRNFLKTTLAAPFLAGAAPLLTGMAPSIVRRPRLSEVVIGHGEFRYRVETDWSDLNPEATPSRTATRW